METKMGDSIEIYDNLFSDRDWNSWNILESFPFEKLSESDEIFAKISALEIIFEGTQGDSEKNGKLFDTYQFQVTEILTGILSHRDMYLFVSEPTGAKKNRVRSFKGLLPKKVLNKMDYLEVEIPLSNDQTIICGLVKVTPENLRVCFDYFMDNSRCFVINGNSSFYSELFLNEIIKECFFHPDGFYLDYSVLFSKYCLKGNPIFRSGGDGGDREVSLQCFYLKNQKEILHELISSTV